MTADRLARIVVRLYPRAWRSRYQDEVLARLDERPPTSRDVIDLLASCAWQWTGAALRGGWSWIDSALRLVATALLFTLPALALSRTLPTATMRSLEPWLPLLTSLLGPLLLVRILALNYGNMLPSSRNPGRVRIGAAETQKWRLILFVAATVDFTFRSIPPDGYGLYSLIVGFPGMGFWMLDMYAAKPILIRAPSRDVPAAPLGLS